MAKHRVFQNKLQEELDDVLGDCVPTIDDFEYLPLLEASISETQRIRSVVPIGIPHGCLDQTNINGYSIPKNTMIIPLQWAIHMDEKIWDKPNNFNPLRFIDEECRYVRTEYLIPFQTGE